MSFEWRTDEDEGWPEEVTAEETAVTPQSFLRRRWRFLLVSLLGLLAVWLVVQWQIDQRVAETTATIENEILATHNFVLQTAVNQDESLFHANLSGRNPDWTELQKTLLNQGLLLNRPMLGWEHQPSANRLTPADVTFELDPDLQGAALTYPQAYASQTGAQVTETVVLQQTAVYRKGTSRWLYAPPDDDFWGNWITQQGDYLTLAFTERDNEVATVLAIQLDRLLGQMCTEMADMNCGPDFQVHLRFDTDPQSLLALNEIETMLKAGLQLELPTPTLIGLPTDEASAEALYRAYGVQLFTAVLAHQIDYDCCRHQLFFRALRDYQLAQLDLQPWPLTPAMYRQMLDNGFDGDVNRHWTRRWEEAPPQFLQVWVIEDPDPIWQQVYMLVEFLAAEETAVSPTQMMRLMDRNSYDAWLAGLVPSHKRLTFEDRFLLYINNQIIPGQQAEPPIPLPNGQITLVCQNYTDRPTSHVYSYDLAQKTWTERFRDMFTNAYFSTRDGEHFIVSEYDFVDGTSEWEISLATDEEIILLEKARSPGENEYWLDYSLIDEDAQYFIRYEYFGGETDIRLLPLACVDGSCSAVPLEGYPLFSPDKALFLIESAPGEMINVDSSVPFQLLQNLYLMTPDGAVRQSLGQGSDPFWLTNTVYGYVRLGDDGWELVTAVINQNQPRYLLSQADLLAAMPADARPDGLFVTSVAANPVNAQEILLQIRNDAVANQSGPDVPSYLFKVTLTDDLAGVNEVKLLRQDFFSGIFGFWRDGRTIIYGEYGFEYLDVNWQMLNPETGQTERSFQSLVSLAGTQDGQWLVQVTDSYLLLRALAYDYQYFIPHSFQDCQWAVLSAAE